jgi:transcription elongation factor GreA
LVRKSFHLTATGIEIFRLELASLRARRAPIAERIKAAREFGDLSENAEYASARQEQERVENRIAEVENILRNVKLIEESEGGDKVQLGTMVTLRDQKGTMQQFKVVGTVEADPLNGLISDESPLGQAILSKAVGEEIEVTSRVGIVIFTIIKIG